MASKGRRKKKDQKLIDTEGGEENGITNPLMEENAELSEGHIQSGGESATEIDETVEAEHLVKDLKIKHSQKQKELSQVKSPKDDLAGEMRTIKRDSKQKIEETEKREEEEDAALAAEALGETDDGTIPMPPEEEGEPTTTVSFKEEPEIEGEESAVKKLKRRKEKIEEEEVVPLTAETAEEAPAEPPSEPPPPPARQTSEEPKDAKTPRGASLKERMRARLKKAEEEAVSEVKEKEREERREKRLKRETKRTRFDSEMDDAEMQRIEEKARQLKERLKKRGQTMSERGIFMPTNEEAYEFFTRVWEPEPEEPVKKEEEEKAETEPKEKKEGEEEEEAGPSGEKKEGEEEEEEKEGEKEKKKEKAEDETPLLAAMEEDYDDEGYGYIAVRKAEYDDSPETQKKEQDMLFYPSSAQIPSTEKVAEQVQPRFLEDEGFYVGTKPDIPKSNLNKMEHRLLKEPDNLGKRWFGEDGRLIALPDPLRPTSSRPPVPEEQEPYLETEYRKAIMHEYDYRYIDGAIDGTGFYQLDVDINSVWFSHHHLYSREHVLAMRLTELYEQFLARKKKNMTEYLNEKLKALKNSSLHLRDHMLSHKSEHTFADRSNYERRLQDYKYEIRRTRSLRDREEGADRTLLKNIIRTWKEIKTLRQQQNYNNTNVHLEITREEVDKARDQLLWKSEMEEELEEMREEHQEEYNRKLGLYEEEMNRWKNQQEAKKEAMKRQKKRDSKTSQKSKQSRQSKLSGEAAEQTEEEKKRDAEILNEEEYPQPDPPQKFDEDAARQTIKDKAMEIRRRPGEPIITPELTHTASITPTNDCPRGEQSRRDEISKCKIFIKVMFNQKEVSRTSAKPLAQDFKMTFGQIFNLKIVQWPESITFQIHEQRGFGSEVLAELCAGIPEVSVTSLSVQLENLDFSSDHRVEHGHEGVGSGVPFSFGPKGTDMLTLMTTGELCCSVGWAVDEDGSPLAPPTGSEGQENLFSAIKKMDPISAIGAAGVTDYEKLSKWFQESRLDPNDPNNADLVFMLKPKGETTQLMVADYFRLEQLQEEFNLTTDEEIELNKRFKLIQLRDTEVQEFRNYKMIPLNDREIPRDTFQEYERKKKEAEKLKEEKDIESHRAAVTKYMQRIREKVLQRFRLLSHQKRLEDIVNEDAVPNIALLGTRLMRLTQRRRPLQIQRKERKKVTAVGLKPDEVHILVSITRALNIPIRSHTAQTDTDKKATKSIVGETLVQPFVEVMFQHNSFRTTVGDGPNPSFNEELTIPFKAPNDDFSPSSLQTVTDDIFLNLFDEVVVDIQEDDRQRASTVHQRIERKWLGSLKIPFSTLYVNSKIEGTFQIKSPPILLGYSDNIGEDEDTTKWKDTNTYLSLFITIEPSLNLGEPAREKFSSNEDEKLLNYAEQWQSNLENKHTTRDYKTSVVDVNGKAVFITRYFKPLKPPEELTTESSGATPAERIARYVSLIPFVSDSVVFPGLCDIWSTCDQFLQMLAGDEEEHAVLLCNYFLSIGKQAWLVVGRAIPEGPTAYVMTEEGSGEYWIWNPGTGDHFKHTDNYCPLQSVGCLINNENIWGNIQQYERPSQMNFRLSDTSSWQPCFGKSFPSPGLGSIQPESLYYFKTDDGYVIELTEKIEQKLKDKIMEWRNRFITRWNRHCTQIMRKLLPMLEDKCGRAPGKEHLEELEKSFGSYKVSGFPINIPFTELNNIIEAVFATGVHDQESSDVEFALAVYIKAYPNSVLSVWIYVASLIRMR